MISHNKEIPEDKQCVVCYCQDEDVTHKCNQCKETWLCGSCVSQMQENGQARNCPVCKKGSPWCDSLPLATSSDDSRETRVYYSEKIVIILRKIMLGIMTICVCWLIGYLFALANDGEMRQISSYPLAMAILMYIMLGFMISAMVGLVIFVCSLCFVTCLSLGTPQ